jgi:hypothetical protein
MKKFKTFGMVAIVAVSMTMLTSYEPVCQPQSTGIPELIANPNNCCEYFECDNGLPRPMACPDDLFFCSELGACAYSWNANCSFNCTVVSDWCGGNDWTGGGGGQYIEKPIASGSGTIKLVCPGNDNVYECWYRQTNSSITCCCLEL